MTTYFSPWARITFIEETCNTLKYAKFLCPSYIRQKAAWCALHVEPEVAAATYLHDGPRPWLVLLQFLLDTHVHL